MEHTKTVYACPDGTPFEVEWPSPEMAAHAWRWDQLHCPVPFSPMSSALGRALGEGFQRAMDFMGAPARLETITVHGYRYQRPVARGGDPAVRAATRARYMEEHTGRAVEDFEADYRPEVEAIMRSVLSWADGNPPLQELTGRLDQLMASRRRLGELHQFTMEPAAVARDRFLDYCIARFGADGERWAADMTRGLPNKSLESAVALWDLARCVAERPALVGLLKERPAAAFLRESAGLPGGSEFAAAFAAFMDTHGWRTESFVELDLPMWREDPAFVLFMLRSYLGKPADSSPGALHRAAKEQRVERIAQAEARLDAEQIPEFRQLLSNAYAWTILVEDHNFWIDQRATAAYRVPCLAMGHRLVELGSVTKADDVFYLLPDEVAAASRASGVDYRAIVGARRAERQQWTRVLPPTFIGSGEFASNVAAERFFGTFPKEPDPPGVVRGQSGSAGVVRGIARLIFSLDDVERLGDGDILVTYATAPPWTPLFAVAGGIVTDSGGPLAHCAVVAREYGIPAVVAARTATARIRDGMLIEVDGTSGMVRLLDG